MKCKGCYAIFSTCFQNLMTLLYTNFKIPLRQMKIRDSSLGKIFTANFLLVGKKSSFHWKASDCIDMA
ncbi:hypothetical protein T06_11484 [Trichinella sp. T6]|nr:hypothetical protein T06_11484 [Trichinella sp. T6]